MKRKAIQDEGGQADLADLPPRKGSLSDLLRADFLAHGEEAIEIVRRKHPTIYLRLIADVLPEELSLAAIELGMIGDEELVRIIRLLRAQASAVGAGEHEGQPQG
jgi:hypothetical protein